MSDRNQLLAMGFPQDRVDWALRATQSRGLQPALDHIIENEDKSIPNLALGAATIPDSDSRPNLDGDEVDEDDAAAIRAAMGKATANSIKCSQCGKTFKNVDLANFHAEKSGHDQFEESTEEIKPLTEAEKKAKLEELRAKMAEKREKKAILDAGEQKANEALRRKAGKDQAKAQEELKAKQIQKEVEQKRKDKIEDAKAKAVIRAQIEADKKARAEKAAKEKALREGKTWTDAGVVDAPESKPAAPVTESSSGLKGSDYKDTRLQIRSGGGPPMSLTFPSDKTLYDVALAFAEKNPSFGADSVTFTMSFPRRVFTRDEFGNTLRDLGLTPSAVLQAT
ncbi:ubiquitin-related domain-containing protein [Cantharellus anzutake]|uniref:ubiquitin-related domain-containing protein n=1 Tax=Cantharellus anzutake TaxID=1750568 RepID=UPI001905DD5D|nr:ubiquitin-related domain-containing protein [Cantharellus anzutake]KAF8329431.1 ubiquitin-related domain-containing protein [Cantharellus anzutake]